MNSFSYYHPLVLFFYFASVILFSMFFFHPVILIISLGGAFLFDATSQPLSSTARSLTVYFVLFVLVTLTNPLFSHDGVTVLFFFNNNPVTMEAVYYGMGIGAMLAGVMYWFKNYTRTMSSDKSLYLFARISPGLSLVLSSVFRFIPIFKRQMKKVFDTQKTLGIYKEGSFSDKIRSGVAVFSVMVTWSLETAFETAASMKARGYGFPGRTGFSVFKFTRFDAVAIVYIFIFSATVVSGALSNGLEYSFYPSLSGIDTSPLTIISYGAFFLMAFFPGVYEIKEKIKWKYFLSKV